MVITSIAFIGGGRITRVFLTALNNANALPQRITVFDPDSEALMKLKRLFPNIETKNDDICPAAESDMVFLAVHPSAMLEVLAQIKPFLRTQTIVISLAPKITIREIQSALDGVSFVARVNPSAAGIINQGINPVTFDSSFSEAQRQSVLNILFILGKAPVVEEPRIEAYAMISALGPTYFWFQWKKLQELAVEFGMDTNEAEEVIAGMVTGAVKTLYDSGLPFEEVRDLIPADLFGEEEEIIKGIFDEKLKKTFVRIKP